MKLKKSHKQKGKSSGVTEPLGSPNRSLVELQLTVTLVLQMGAELPHTVEGRRIVLRGRSRWDSGEVLSSREAARRGRPMVTLCL